MRLASQDTRERPVSELPGRNPKLLDRALRSLLSHRFGGAPLRFALFDGTELSAGCGTPVATVRVRDRATLLQLLLDPESRFGEGYTSGRIEVHGDFIAAIEAAYRALEAGAHRARSSPAPEERLRSARENVHRHYDLGNDFYRLWLDERLLYTCAYFASPDCSLESAQLAKMDRVCEKLRLRPGERVVEAGCGWGGLALHMARRHGVAVQAFNVSSEQIRYARAWAAREGLADRVEFIDDDYRCIAGRFDAFVSLGMLEHVGVPDYPLLGDVIDRCLEPRGGRGLLHFIGRDHRDAFNPWIQKHIFPGAYPPALSEAIEGVLESAGLSVLDVENLRPHYARTLTHWRSRFEAAAATVSAQHGPEFTRAWHLYLAGSEAAFRSGALQLFQVVFARSGSNVAWSRGGEGDAWRAATP